MYEGKDKEGTECRVPYLNTGRVSKYIDKLEETQGGYGAKVQAKRQALMAGPAREYHDAVVILVKKDALGYVHQELERARGVALPENARVYDVVDAVNIQPIVDAIRAKQEEGIVPVILDVGDEDVEGNLSAIMLSLEKLAKAGWKFEEWTTPMILAGGDGKRNYALTASDGLGNKGLVAGLNGEPNLYQALLQTLQVMPKGVKGIVTTPVDRPLAIGQDIAGQLGRHDIQIIGSAISPEHPEWDYYGKIRIDAEYRMLSLMKREGPEEKAYMQEHPDWTHFPANNLTCYYFSAKAIRRLLDTRTNPITDGPDIGCKKQDVNQNIGKAA
jgi:hypothetical protein